MSLLLVPYTNGMRLGQGFNSYTQQICVDDAVVVDNQRAENILLNDGTTMRILAQSQAKPSAWTRQLEVVVDQRDYGIPKGTDAIRPGDALSVDTEQITTIEPEQTTATESLQSAQETEQLTGAAVDGESDQNESLPKDTSSGNDEQAEEQAATTEATSEETPSAANATPTEGSNSPVLVEATPTDDVSQETTSEVPSQNAEVAQTDSSNAASEEPTIVKHAPKSRVRSASTGQRGGPAAGKTQGLSDSLRTATRARPATQSAAQAKAGQAKRSPGWAKLEGTLAARKAAQLKADEEELQELRRIEKQKVEDQRKYQAEIDRENREEDRIRRTEEREEQRKIREEKRKFEDQRRAEMYKAIKGAAAANKDAKSMEEMQAILKQNQFAERWNGMGEQTHNWSFDASAPRGPSQTVTYTSRFVDRLSDITDDMCISGALSIKAAKIGGSGRGSFIDSDKFKNSDLTFYISVKVINQTINFKDALEYKPMRGVNKENFSKVYGDSFISGFLEGGEFNAVVSMKILNKAKKTDIQAQAKVAFTAGPMSVEADANVGIARENIETNTETTIQVSWCGGGHIKPMEQQWDLKSLMQAAARFPDLVADCPQRTYAILTKYDNLRSFVTRQPAGYSKLQYENAQIYTNVLMDAFMSYKALYTRLSDQIFQIGQKTMTIVPWAKGDGDTTTAEIATAAQEPPISSHAQRQSDARIVVVAEDKSRFEASVEGLDAARKAIRRQMVRIVNEVDQIEKDPKLATDEDHQEPFQSTASFEARLPVVEVPERLRPKQTPLTGRRIVAKPQSEEKRIEEAQEIEGAAPLYDTATVAMEPYETEMFNKCIELNPALGYDVKVTAAVGDKTCGKPFNNLDFVSKDWVIKAVEVRMSEGVVRHMKLEYENGLIVQKGPSSRSGQTFRLDSFVLGERITTCMMETGIGRANSTYICSLRLYTNRGRSLLAQAKESKPTGDHAAMLDGVEYTEICLSIFECPLTKGTLKGFFGRADAKWLRRLGVIWGNALPEESPDPGDESRPKVDCRILPSKYGLTTSTDFVTHTARFGLSYYTIPQVIFALSEVRTTYPGMKPAAWKAHRKEATEQGFTYTASLDFDASHWGELKHSWMTLPRSEVTFETGSHDFEREVDDSMPNGSGTYQVTFSKPYKTIPATPAIWCLTLDYSGGEPTRPDARLRARVEDLTTMGFKLVVETWGDATHAGNNWAWCVWDKEYDGVKVKTGTTSFQNTATTQGGNLRYWEPDFGGKVPVSIMTGIRGFDISLGEGGRFHAKCQFEGQLDNGGISYGVDMTTQARWMEVMYVAILEN